MFLKQRRGAHMAFDVDFAGAVAGDGGAVSMFADMPDDMPLIVAGGAVGMFADMPPMPLMVAADAPPLAAAPLVAAPPHAAVAPPLAAVEPPLDAAPPIRRVCRRARKTLFEKAGAAARPAASARRDRQVPGHQSEVEQDAWLEERRPAAIGYFEEDSASWQASFFYLTQTLNIQKH